MFDGTDVTKTIAAGTWSPVSFASIITGQTAAQHSVQSFKHRLNGDAPTIFDHAETTSFINQGKNLGNVLGTEGPIPRTPLNELEPPFLYMERCLIPHAPFNYAEDEYLGSVQDYCIANYQNANKDYADSAQSSIDKFRQRVETLREMGILDDTLIIFTSDHGELLGEHGHYGHGTTTTPELTYVPTVFYNEGVGVSDGFAHIDVYPTIADVFGGELSNDSHGTSVFKGIPEERIIYNQSKHGEHSAWDANGGYVFYDKTALFAIGWWGSQLTKSPYAKLNRKHPASLLRTAMYGLKDGVKKWGQPGFDINDARIFCERSISESDDSMKRELDGNRKEQLRDLGYI